MLIPLVVDFDLVTADMAPGTIWYPHHMFSSLWRVTCLRRWLEIEIHLSRLIRIGLRVHDRCLDRAIHKQCYSVNARLQALSSIAALWISLNRAANLFAIPRFDPNVCLF